MSTTLTSFSLINANLTRSLASTAKQPMVARETQYYLSHIKNVKSVDDLMSNGRLYIYALKAWGLSDMAYAKAFIRKVLTEGVDTSKSFANTLSDTRYREFAAAFNFKAQGDQATSSTDAGQGTVDRYVRQKLEEDAGKQNEGVRLALYFERKASSVKSPYGILADKALLQVFETAYDLPASISLLDIEKQAKLISSRLKIADLQDPEKVKKLMTSFAAKWEIANPTTGTQSPILQILQPVESSVSSDLLTSLQNLKLGGV